MNKKIQAAIRISAAAAILYFILSLAGPLNIISTISKARPQYVTLSVLMTILVLLLNTMNLKILLSVHTKISYRKLFKHYAYSWSLGLLTPGKLGEFSLAFSLDKKTQTACTLIIDKIVALLVLILYSSIGLLMLSDIAGAIIAFIGIWLLAAAAIFSNTGRSIIGRVLKGQKFKDIADFLRIYTEKHKRYIALNFGFSMARWLLISSISFLLLLSFGVETDMLGVLSIVSISTLAGMIPITISGLGIREGTFIYFATQIGIDTAVATSASLISLLIAYITAFLIILSVRRA